jgi:hypothetical protein
LPDRIDNSREWPYAIAESHPLRLLFMPTFAVYTALGYTSERWKQLRDHAGLAV